MKAETLALEADVLVLGGGLAGCNASISAAEAAARVVLLDKFGHPPGVDPMKFIVGL